ncbi:NYN domain-containing protein [Campylobacter jejuni]|nr:NYN domain-containing protein [Campylobacter jejuni]EAJ7478387.1 NYN domain-containing protein [Campylobacter jejuni]EAJ7480084.1 NYN domain-containing protein [Campylobacter jejuni]EAL4351038.1 hypothetical protein [Campylobacter jejuni]ECP5976832.1 NYN domain-containing protein [Campylobacter jejuni]
MENKSIAIFIDAENIPAKYAKSIFDIASDYGEVIIKRIYGDWTQKNIQGWREQIAEYSLIAMQQFNFAANKNSSDSDYTSLIQKLRENKKQVIGMGLEKSIKSYVNAFSEFFYLDKDESKKEDILSKDYLRALINITEQLIDEKGRAEYAQIRTNMNRKYSDFHPQNYGFKNFRALIQKFLPKMKKFEEEREKNIYFLVKKDYESYY